ncbi:hypothetical protein PCANC_13356 [Puccinia coronata f. sp. avenae]|uniref:CCHC-type domain-containing protein n=1 Tax=Puccinia coronata f. sp. avenae TaxID=200324 RepID=A0A2N5STU2_9BASI|nr:hypothetical protein PCANC_13356 [Puccinia coronata f. sp. avenae]
MNDRDDPLKKELPDSDYESVPETKSKDSNDSSIKRDLPTQIRHCTPFIPSTMEELKALANQMDDMKRQFAEQLRVQNELLQNQSNELFTLKTHAANQPHPSHSQNVHLSHAENVLKQFIKSPIKMFYDENPKKPILAFDGSNYPDWEKAIDRTLVHAFDRDASFIEDLDNFEKLNQPENRAVASLIRNSLDPALVTIIESGTNNKSRERFLALRKRCTRRSGRRHKLMAIEKILRLASERPPASKTWLASWCALKADLDRVNPTLDEVWGLLLQAVTTPPSGVDKKNFDYSISQPLDNMDTPPAFNEVTTIIQSALSKTSSCTSTLSPGTIPTDVEMSVGQIAAYKANARYVPPQILQQQDPQAKSKFSVEKASFYKGKNQTDSLYEQYGYACLYCREEGHWYSDCDVYWEDVCFGRIKEPPTNHAEKGSRYVPPMRPQKSDVRPNNNKLRKIDLPNVHDGVVLVDSGATTNVSGPSPFFTITAKLPAPRSVSLAVSDCIAPLNYVGRLSIPTSKGTISVDDVYFCKGVKGSILSTGWLVAAG